MTAKPNPRTMSASEWNEWRRSNPDIDIAMSQADLREANLTNKNLARVSFPYADMTGVDLTNSDLSHANLQGVILDDADIANANLRYADMRGARLRKSVISVKAVFLALISRKASYLISKFVIPTTVNLQLTFGMQS
jgi:uncharacterized protein YjbI with pentapeptide repeats